MLRLCMHSCIISALRATFRKFSASESNLPNGGTEQVLLDFVTTPMNLPSSGMCLVGGPGPDDSQGITRKAKHKESALV